MSMAVIEWVMLYNILSYSLLLTYIKKIIDPILCLFYIYGIIPSIGRLGVSNINILTWKATDNITATTIILPGPRTKMSCPRLITEDVSHFWLWTWPSLSPYNMTRYEDPRITTVHTNLDTRKRYLAGILFKKNFQSFKIVDKCRCLFE